jgi:hypothetical protein
MASGTKTEPKPKPKPKGKGKGATSAPRRYTFRETHPDHQYKTSGDPIETENGDSLILPDGKTLTWRQRLFIKHYFGEANGNPVEAARLAGYAFPETDGYRLLRISTIQAAIRQGLRNAGLDTDEILARWAEQASGLGPEYWTDEGRLDFKRLKADGLTHLVKRATPTKCGMAHELCDPQLAQKLLAQATGLLKEQHNHFHLPNDLSLYSDHQIAAMRRGEDPGPPALQGQPKTVGAEATGSGSGQQGQLEPPGADSTIIETTGGETSGDEPKGG